MSEAAEPAWQRPSGLGVGEETCVAGMWAWARAGQYCLSGETIYPYPYTHPWDEGAWA